jgi:hypothetical protein
MLAMIIKTPMLEYTHHPKRDDCVKSGEEQVLASRCRTTKQHGTGCELIDWPAHEKSPRWRIARLRVGLVEMIGNAAIGASAGGSTGARKS